MEELIIWLNNEIANYRVQIIGVQQNNNQSALLVLTAKIEAHESTLLRINEIKEMR